VIAESEKTVVVEGNHYFPPESVNTQHLKPSRTTSRCPWKGLANYCSLIVDGKINEDAAWYYANPSDAATAIKGYIAFWKGVDVLLKTGSRVAPYGPLVRQRYDQPRYAISSITSFLPLNSTVSPARAPSIAS
jgi:hypothetical protein